MPEAPCALHAGHPTVRSHGAGLLVQGLDRILCGGEEGRNEGGQEPEDEDKGDDPEDVRDDQPVRNRRQPVDGRGEDLKAHSRQSLDDVLEVRQNGPRGQQSEDDADAALEIGRASCRERV